MNLNYERVWENDPDLKTVNLNNILNIPQELLEELMEALEGTVNIVILIFSRPKT